LPANTALICFANDNVGYGRFAPVGGVCSILHNEPIVLKNYSLIVAQAADSICLLDRGICDVGTKAGGAGSTVL
jgi:hypothetical protein